MTLLLMVGVADFAVAAPLESAERARIPLRPYANVRRWYDTIAGLEAWQKTAPKTS